MRHQLRAGLMHGLDGRSRELKLPTRLERNRTAAGDIEQADDVAVLGDGLPAEQVLHAFEQGANAASAVVGDRVVALDHEHELLVLGADAKLRLGFAARFEPRDKFLARFDRRHVDLVAGHADVPTERAATLHGAHKGGQLADAPARALPEGAASGASR
jgi:hypothetical protein